MAEEDNKTAQNTDEPVNQQANQAKPKKRRPRRRKKKPAQSGDVFKIKQKEPQKPKKRRPRKRKPKPQTEPKPPEQKSPKKEEPIPAIEPEVEEETKFEEPEAAPEIKIEPTPEPEPMPEPEPEPTIPEEEIKDQEEAFLASDDSSKEPGEVITPPELPDEISPESTPTTPSGEGEAEGPVGWDQLKQAIKQDHEATKDSVPSVVPAPVPESEPVQENVQEVQEPEPIQEAAPVPESEPEVTEPTPVVAPTEELGADEEAEKKEIIRIITKYAVGGCLVIAIIAGIFLFKLPQRIFSFIADFGEDGAVQEQVVEEPDQLQQQDQEENETKEPETEVDEFEEGVGTALLTGETIPMVKRASSSIQAVYKVGLPEVEKGHEDVIASYMSTLTKLQNAFTTDIHKLLDNSTNRAQALQVHLSELNVALDEANSAYEDLSTERDTLKEMFNEKTTKKNDLEEEFFTAIENLRGQESNALLIDFIDASTDQIDLKAQYNALSKLKEMYEVAIANMDARIKDIELNKSALIKGVKVVDIKGSDLELIIQEGEL